jgi:hypothetical protein
MDFSGVTDDTGARVSAVINYILGLNISPDEKVSRISNVVRSVGEHFHSQLFGAASEVFDSASMASRGLDNTDGQAQRLATKIVRNYALGRETATLVSAYYNSVLGSAQEEAFNNAVSMQKHPTLTRSIVGETCKWCESKAGTHTNPTAEDFARHDKCDCLFIVSGYNSRNGLLSNYSKGKAKK